jgi:spectrin beta
MKYLRHKAFESEINANRNRLDQLEKDSAQLFSDQDPQSDEEIDHEMRDKMKDDVAQRIGDLNRQWDELQETTRVKGEKLFDANRGILFQQSVDSIDIWVKEIEKHLQYTTYKSKDSQADANDLKKTNILLEKQGAIEKELEMRQKQVIN